MGRYTGSVSFSVSICAYCTYADRAQILKMVHDDLGHNGTHRTYMLLKRLYILERSKTNCNKTHTEMLSLSKKE